ncbi:MAG: hypothetical protein JO246_14510 [Frankiaceae bacterium]|nr:hypothetical protein [Frankiaceae bacterium]MBV9871849.1 hypothetical protein [Frankiaceae bacterium]
MTFEFNEEGIEKMLAQAKDTLEAQANPRLRDAVRAVRDRYAGEDAGTVYQQLVAEITSELGPKFDPNEANLRAVAQAIVDGTLTG